MTPPLKRLVACSLVYMVIALIGAAVAIAEHRPSEAGGWTTGLPAARDFLYGNGTAMSPALYWLIAQAILTRLATRNGRWGAVGVIGLSVLGLLYGVGELIEPIVFEASNAFEKTIIAGLIVVPLVMMLLGILEWGRRRSAQRTKI